MRNQALCHILQKSEYHFGKGAFATQVAREVAGDGLLAAGGNTYPDLDLISQRLKWSARGESCPYAEDHKPSIQRLAAEVLPSKLSTGSTESTCGNVPSKDCALTARTGLACSQMDGGTSE